MSEYMETLERYRLERADVDLVPAAERGHELVVDGEAAASRLPPTNARSDRGRVAAPIAGGAEGDTYAVLLDNLRARGNGKAVSQVVLAGASAIDDVHGIALGLARQAERRGLRVSMAELYSDGGVPLLQTNEPVSAQGDRAASNGPAGTSLLPVDMRGGPVPEPVRQWLSSTQSRHDMLIIEAQPLTTTLDAALLASACDGLVVAVTAGETSAHGFESSIARARGAGCRLLGLVVTEPHDRVSGWLRR